MSALPKHSRPVPAEWNDLLAQSDQTLTTYAVPLTARERMYSTVDQLPDERLEANRYYALGIASCYFMQQMADAEVRAGVIDRAAAMMARRSAENAGRGATAPGIRFKDLHATGLDSAANPVAAAVDSRLVKPVKLLADALNTVGMSRICLAKARAADSSMTADKLVDDSIKVGMMYSHGQPITTRRVIQNSLAGAMSVYRRAVQARFFPDGPPLNEPNPRLFDTITAADLGNLQPLTVSRKAAGLRADEHASPLLDELLVGDRQGDLQFRRDRLSSQPTVGKFDSVLTVIHQERLTCPALQVDGAIRQSLQLIPDIVIRAQELVVG